MTNDVRSPEELHLRLKKILLNYEIDNFRRYLEVMEESLRNRAQETSTEMQRIGEEIQKSGESAERRAELTELLVESYRFDGFANLMRQSFFVCLYAFLELWLLRECRIEGKRTASVKLSPGDLRGSVIEKAKVYLSKVLGSEFRFDTSREWEKIKKYKLLRNCIVHRQGSLTGLSGLDVDPSLEKFVDDEEGLHLRGPGSKILVEGDFCVEALRIIHTFLMQILFPQAAAQPIAGVPSKSSSASR